MARQKTQVEYNDFTRGFITEASPLTFPENASLDEGNVNINRDGSRQRRFGLNWTLDALKITHTTPISTSNEAINSFTWRSVNNDGDINFGVLQRGDTLYFFDLDAADPSSNLVATHVFGIFMPDKTTPMSFASAYGRLFVSIGTQVIFVGSWDGVSMTLTPHNLEIRDVFGIDEGTAVDLRPVALTANHQYNLRNQGWAPSTLLANVDVNGLILGAATVGDSITHTNNILGFHPSNSDLIWACDLASLGASTSVVSNLGAYDPTELRKQHFGTTPAPKGKFVIDLFARSVGRINQSGVAGLPSDGTAGWVDSVAAFAGRIWYSIQDEGIIGGDENSPFLGNMVLYSQASNEESKWTRCYSSNDPAAEDFSDVLDTDGGFISITEAGQILELIPMGESLYVFATNGVWEIFGGDTGFSATTQTVVKITDIGALNGNAIVDGEGAIVYWAESGIFAVTIDPTTLRAAASNITEDTIQSFYDDIPIERKREARGEYDSIAKQVVWLYNTEVPENENYYKKELVFDIVRNAYTKRTFTPPTKPIGDGPFPVAHLKLQHLLQGATTEAVTSLGIVVTSLGVPVTVTVSDAEQQTKTSLMYWMASTENDVDEDYYLGGYTNFDFLDFERINGGTDAPAFILTGYLTGGDSSRYKYTPYISVKLKRTETDFIEDALGNIELIGESSCIMQAQWEWTNDVSAGRWSNPQQVYRLPRFTTLDASQIFSHDVVNTRNKVRGKGRALSLRFSSEPAKDMFLLGWGKDVLIKDSV